MKIRMHCAVALLAVLGGAGICNYAQAQNTTLYVAQATPGRAISPTANPELPWDFSVNGICIIQGISFGEIRGPFTGPAGTYTVEFEVANSAFPCTGNTIFSASVTLSAGVTNFEVATLDASNHVIGQLYTADLTSVGVGQTRVEVINATNESLIAAITDANGATGKLTSPAGTITEGFIAVGGLYTGRVYTSSNVLAVGPIQVQATQRNSLIYVLAGSSATNSLEIIGPKEIRDVF